jgi:hypothetical protein
MLFNILLALTFYIAGLNFRNFFDNLLEGEPIPAITSLALSVYWWPLIPAMTAIIMLAAKVEREGCALFCLICIPVEVVLIFVMGAGYLFPLVLILEKLS